MPVQEPGLGGPSFGQPLAETGASPPSILLAEGSHRIPRQAAHPQQVDPGLRVPQEAPRPMANRPPSKVRTNSAPRRYCRWICATTSRDAWTARWRKTLRNRPTRFAAWHSYRCPAARGGVRGTMRHLLGPAGARPWYGPAALGAELVRCARGDSPRRAGT